MFPFTDIRREFDVDPDVLYLNSGTHSLCPRSVLDAVTRHQREYERNPTAGMLAAFPRLWSAQKQLAAFLGAEACDIFLRPNVTEALNAIILGAPIPPGSEILVTDLEYGAIVNICRYRAERDGLSVRTCPAENVIAELRSHTAMVLVSHVVALNGAILPIERIAKETRDRGILLVVDGAHAPGALALDFSTLGDIDFYGGNLHKWLMGPKGTAFGWVNRRHHDRLPPPLVGWSTFEAPEFMSGFGDGSRFAQKFVMPGCRDFAPFFAIEDTLAFWRKHGPKNIRARIYELQTRLEQKLDASCKWKRASPPAGSERGPLLAYEFPEALQKTGWQLIRDLQLKHRLQLNVGLLREKWIARFSPHIYNTENELERAATILTSIGA